MKCNVERLIEALVGAELMAQRKRSEEQSRRQPDLSVVTVSRGYGAQGAELAHALAERLGVRCCDRHILQEVARIAHVDTDLVRSLDEKVKRIQGDWWHALVDEKHFTHEHYFQHLVKVVLAISASGDGGVIVGRGAHLILGFRRAFRVRIVAGLPSCAQRIAQRENLPLEAARRRVLEVNEERARYIRQMYKQDIEDSTRYDLTLNSDRFGVEEMVRCIVFSMQLAGCSLPEHEGMSR